MSLTPYECVPGNIPLTELLGASRYSTALDLGCGDGRNTLGLSHFAEKVYGLDRSINPSIGELQSSASNPYRTHQIGQMNRVQWIEGDATEYCSSSELKFDLVVCRFLLGHISDPTQFIQSVRRVALKRFIISEWHPAFAWYANPEGWVWPYLEEGETFSGYHYSISTVTNALLDAGFSLLKTMEAPKRNTTVGSPSLQCGSHLPVAFIWDCTIRE